MTEVRQPRSVSLHLFFLVCAFLPFLANNVYAAPLPFFDTIPDGRIEFDGRVNGANGTLYSETLSGLTNNTNSWALSDFTITSSNNANRSVDTTRLNPAPTGLPGGDGINMTADGSVTSGLTFTFNNPINGFGIELDDWATCCYPSSLYISFDGGAPILIGTANQASDNPGAAQSATTFIGAIDDSGTFTVVTFYGTGNGDVLFAGGIIRYAIVPLGSISSGGSGYVETASPTGVSELAEYFDDNDGSGERATVANYLDNSSEEEVETALKTIFPVNTSVTGQTMLSSSGQTANVLIDKVGTVLGSMSSVSTVNFAGGAGASAQWLLGDIAPAAGAVPGFPEMDVVAGLAASPYQKFVHDERAFWFEGVAAGANGSDTSTTLGYDTKSHGVVAGYEYALDKDHLVGVVGSVFRSNVDLDNEAGETDVNNYNLGLYGQKLFGSVKLTGVAMAGYGDYDTERNIDIAGITSTPESDYDSWSFSASAGISRLYEHGDNLKIEPFGLVSYTTVKTDGYTEEGGGAFNMTVSDDSFSTATAKTGVALRHESKISEKKLELQVKPYIGYQKELNGADNKIGFSGAAAAATVNGRDLSTPILGIAAEIKYEMTDQSTFKAGIDLAREEDEDRYVGFVGVGLKF